jgi:hypothetical protein
MNLTTNKVTDFFSVVPSISITLIDGMEKKL